MHVSHVFHVCLHHRASERASERARETRKYRSEWSRWPERIEGDDGATGSYTRSTSPFAHRGGGRRSGNHHHAEAGHGSAQTKTPSNAHSLSRRRRLRQRQPLVPIPPLCAYVSICQHMSAFVSICQHTTFPWLNGMQICDRPTLAVIHAAIAP